MFGRFDSYNDEVTISVSKDWKLIKTSSERSFVSAFSYGEARTYVGQSRSRRLDFIVRLTMSRPNSYGRY